MKTYLPLWLAVVLAGCVDPHRSFWGSEMKPLWRMAHGNAGLLLIEDGILYARVAQPEPDGALVLCAFEAKTGKQLWKSEFATDYPDSTTIAGGVLYTLGYPVGTDKDKTRRLHALDPKSGWQLWESKSVVDRIDYVLPSQFGVTMDRKARLVDPKTGADSVSPIDGIVRGAAVERNVEGDVAYTVSADGIVHATTATQILWSAQLPGPRFFGPVIAGDNVYFYCPSPDDFKGCHTQGGEILPEWGIYAFDRKTGELRWKWRPEGSRLSGMAADANTVYVSGWNEAGMALALDAATGQTKWTRGLNWKGPSHYFRKAYPAPVFYDQTTVIVFDQPPGTVPGLDPENLENKGLGTLVRAYNRTTGAPVWESKLPWKYDNWQVDGGLLCATDGGAQQLEDHQLQACS